MGFYRELKNIYHHHPESNKRKSSECNSGSIHPYGRYGNAGKTSKTISTIAILSLVKAIFEKRAATVEVDTFISPVLLIRNRCDCDLVIWAFEVSRCCRQSSVSAIHRSKTSARRPKILGQIFTILALDD